MMRSLSKFQAIVVALVENNFLIRQQTTSSYWLFGKTRVCQTNFWPAALSLTELLASTFPSLCKQRSFSSQLCSYWSTSLNTSWNLLFSARQDKRIVTQLSFCQDVPDEASVDVHYDTLHRIKWLIVAPTWVSSGWYHVVWTISISETGSWCNFACLMWYFMKV